VTAVEHHGQDLVVIGSGNLVTEVVLALDRAGLVAEDVRTEASTLEDAFLVLTEASKNGGSKSGATR
jgi:ABC-2 type transport system ATP-binding protein